MPLVHRKFPSILFHLFYWAQSTNPGVASLMTPLKKGAWLIQISQKGMHNEGRTLMENLSLNQTVLELQCYTIMAAGSHGVWSVSVRMYAYPGHTCIYIYIYVCVGCVAVAVLRCWKIWCFSGDQSLHGLVWSGLTEVIFRISWRISSGPLPQKINNLCISRLQGRCLLQIPSGLKLEEFTSEHRGITARPSFLTLQAFGSRRVEKAPASSNILFASK